MEPPPEPPPHDETMIESSIVEIPQLWREPTPSPPIRRGPILLSLLVALISLGVGGAVLYQRRSRAAESAFLARGEAVLAGGEDPSAFLAEAERLSESSRQGVAVQGLLERLNAHAERRARAANALDLLAASGLDTDFPQRAARLEKAQGFDPESRLIQALRAHLQLEVWAQGRALPLEPEWRALLGGLRAKPPSAALLVARARVRLAQSSSPEARNRALQDLADAAQAGAEPRESGWAAYALAWRAALLQRPRESLPQLDALLVHPASTDQPALYSLAFELRARVWLTLNDLAKASQDAKLAQSRDGLAEGPEALTLWLRSEVLARSGEAPTRAELQQAKAICARWPRSGLALGALAQLEGEAGLASAQRAVELERTSDLTHLALARSLRALGQSSQARDQARHAVLWGRSVAAYLLRSELHLEERRLEEARADLEAARNLSPHDAFVVVAQGRLALAGGDPETARRLAEALLKRSPASAEAHTLLARALGGVGSWEESAKSAGAAIGLEARNPRARLARAAALCEAHQSVLALADLRELAPRFLKAGPFAAEAAYLRGRAHGELGEIPQARVAYELLMRLTSSGDRRRATASRYLAENPPR